MSNKRSLIGRVVIWGILGVGTYTMIQVARPYFHSAAPDLSNSIERKITKAKRNVVKISGKSAEEIKRTGVAAVKRMRGETADNPEGSKSANRNRSVSGTRRIVGDEGRKPNEKTPIKRLGDIADDYIENEYPDVDQNAGNPSQTERPSTAASDGVSSAQETARERKFRFMAEEKKVFERQLSVVDDLLR